MTTNNELPPCKECGMMPLAKTSFCLHPASDCNFYTHQSYFAMRPELWRLIHAPDPRIAELTAQVYELEKLLDESHVVAAAVDTELRALKAKHSAGEYYTPGTIDAVMKASESKAIFDHVAETNPEER